MHQPARITGFMAYAAQDIRARPGMTAQEIVKRAIQAYAQAGTPLSASRSPEASLVATLHQNHPAHGITRFMGQDRRYRFYPAGQRPGPDQNRRQETPTLPTGRELPETQDDCCLDLTETQTQAIEALVQLGAYPDRHEAHRQLARRGLEELLNKIVP